MRFLKNYRWQFTTEGYDLGFGVYKKTKDGKQSVGKMDEVVPTQRADSHLVPEDGSVAVKEPGICKHSYDFYRQIHEHEIFSTGIIKNTENHSKFTIYQ